MKHPSQEISFSNSINCATKKLFFQYFNCKFTASQLSTIDYYFELNRRDFSIILYTARLEARRGDIMDKRKCCKEQKAVLSWGSLSFVIIRFGYSERPLLTPLPPYL